MSEFDELLAKFEEPLYMRRKRIPYVLFGVRRQDFDANGKSSIKPDLFCLDCTSFSGQAAIIQQYLDKGFKLLKYWFPENDVPQVVQKGQIAVEVDEKAGTGFYKQLARFCQMIMDNNPDEVRRLREEKSLLEQRLKEEMSKNAETEGKAGGSSGKGLSGKAEREARV